MKYIMLLLTLVTSPLGAGHYCMDNSEYLSQPYDTKEWHSVECECNCATIKGGHCIECGHLQNARTYEVIKPPHTPGNPPQQSTVHRPDNPEHVLRKLAARYLQNR